MVVFPCSVPFVTFLWLIQFGYYVEQEPDRELDILDRNALIVSVAPFEFVVVQLKRLKAIGGNPDGAKLSTIGRAGEHGGDDGNTWIAPREGLDQFAAARAFCNLRRRPVKR